MNCSELVSFRVQSLYTHPQSHRLCEAHKELRQKRKGILAELKARKNDTKPIILKSARKVVQLFFQE